MIEQKLKFDFSHVHFIGIGGIGMSGLSELMVKSGYTVSGSDLATSPITDRLASLGINLFSGHDAKQIIGADLIIYSSAVAFDNPELSAGRQQGILTVSRADLLGAISRRYHGIAVAGTHGKTTTSAMIGKILIDAGLDPTIILGGILPESDSNVRIGSGELLVVEADEYDRSFHTLMPSISVITTIDGDHMEYFGTQDAIDTAFLTYAHLLPFDRPLIACIDDPGVRRLSPQIRRRITTYGTVSNADVRATNIVLSGLDTSADIQIYNKNVGTLSLPRPGKYHILNALAAISVAEQLEIPIELSMNSLSTFKGVQRRFEIIGEVHGVTIIDDYAHHPTEIEAVLDVLTGLNAQRVTLVFQPHLYSRTRDQAREFGRILSHPKLHQCIITDIFPSRETPIPGVTAKLIIDEARASNNGLIYISDLKNVVDHLKQELKSGDVLITMGAGNINQVGHAFIEDGQ